MTVFIQKGRIKVDWFTENIEVIVAGLILIVVIQWIVLLSVGGKLKKLRKSYRAMMEGTGVENLEGIIAAIKEEQALLKQERELHAGKIAQLEQRVPQQKSNIAIKRYNAFSNTGSDMSFSVAIVNDERDGVVLTSIHSREGAYIYGKPIEKGQSKYSLTPEEQDVIQEAK